MIGLQQEKTIYEYQSTFQKKRKKKNRTWPKKKMKDKC